MIKSILVLLLVIFNVISTAKADKSKDESQTPNFEKFLVLRNQKLVGLRGLSDDVNKVKGLSDFIDKIKEAVKNRNVTALAELHRKNTVTNYPPKKIIENNIKVWKGFYWKNLEQLLQAKGHKKGDKFILPSAHEVFSSPNKKPLDDKYTTHAIRSKIYYSTDVKLYERPSTEANFKKLPAYSFLKDTSYSSLSCECVGICIKNCKGWVKVEAYNGMDGFIHYDEENVYYLHVGMQITIDIKDSNYSISSIWLGEP